MAFGGLLSLLQARVEKAEQLQDAFLPPRLRQARVVHHQIRVDLAVVAADVEAPRRRVVFLNDLYPGHEPSERAGRKERNDSDTTNHWILLPRAESLLFTFIVCCTNIKHLETHS